MTIEIFINTNDNERKSQSIKSLDQKDTVNATIGHKSIEVVCVLT